MKDLRETMSAEPRQRSATSKEADAPPGWRIDALKTIAQILLAVSAVAAGPWALDRIQGVPLLLTLPGRVPALASPSGGDGCAPGER
jgi:hypothetical protein